MGTLLALAFCGPAGAQAGDHAGEEQPPLPAELRLPKAPPLSPEQALSDFRVPAGFRVELVAAEPLLHDPVALSIDGDGRLWVVEMSGYMQDVDGTTEGQPLGAIVVLSDQDGDGRMDRRSVFLDRLVLPRAALPLHGGALVIAPPQLLFCRDTDGDGRADQEEVIEGDLPGLSSPEHAINGLLWGLDNWVYCANAGVRYRWIYDTWQRERTAGGGQWGLCQDDWGRLFFNTNSDPLRAHLVSPYHAARNPNHGNASRTNVRIATDFHVFPARLTPGVNRGYQPQTLVRGKLDQFTAACGPVIYRGDRFPAEYAGAAFVAEPAANLLKCYFLDAQSDGGVQATPAFEQSEFLTSTDERFRPVNLYNGPDGGLYVVDLYRGVLQHKVFMTSFLRRQMLERELEGPLGWGRIWRVVYGDASAPAWKPASQASWKELVAALEHPNGWRRTAAQREMVQRGGDSQELQDLLLRKATDGKTPTSRAHALWALEGTFGLERKVVESALKDPDPRLRAEALRVGEAFLGQKDSPLLEAYRQAAGSAGLPERLQAVLSLGEVATPAAEAVLADVFTADAGNADLRAALMSGLYQREGRFLAELLRRAAWRSEQPGRAALLAALARAVTREGRSFEVQALVELVVTRPEDRRWQRDALVEGMRAGRPRGPKGKAGHLYLVHEPPRRDVPDPDEPFQDLMDSLVWPGKPGVEIPQVEPLDPSEAERFARGRELFVGYCASCHQTSGMGERGKAPPLRQSEWVLGSAPNLVRILRYGLNGPIEVQGETWDMEMPAWNASDADVAAVLTYLRREWGHGADPVAPAEVEAVGRSHPGRTAAFTGTELRELDDS